MSLYTYQVFLTVIEQKSFVKAAQVMHLSPSAVSHAIADLEAELGFSLFLRGRKSTVLTESGQQVQTYIRDILASQKMLDLRATQLRGATAGVVRIGALDSVIVSWLGDILDEYRPLHPEVELHLQENSYQPLIADVIAQELDMAIVSHTSLKDVSAALQYIPLYDDRIVCITKEPLRNSYDGFTPVELLNTQSLILMRDGDEADVAEYLRQQNIAIHCNYTAVTNSSLVAMVRCGFGCGVTPSLALAGCNTEGLCVSPLMPLGFRNLGIITRDPKFLTPAAQEMITCIQKIIRERT